MFEAQSVEDALGTHASDVRKALIRVVLSVHNNYAAAHLASGSRYAMAFGAQWRDLLADAADELSGLDFQAHNLLPGGYIVPVVNNCLVYVWRKPDSATPETFASSRTKRNGFAAPQPDPTLFEGGVLEKPGEVTREDGAPRPAQVLHEVGAAMPVVLVIVRSSPRQLLSIDWAIAELDERTGTVSYRGQECIWEPEMVTADVASEVEPFDAGVPVPRSLEPREAESADPDA